MKGLLSDVLSDFTISAKLAKKKRGGGEFLMSAKVYWRRLVDASSCC